MDLREISQLIKLLKNTDVSEIEIGEEGRTLRLVRAIGGSSAPQPFHMVQGGYPPPPPPPAPTTAAPAPAASGKPANASAIHSPMVGTFYRSSSPEAPPFAQEGDVIKKGQTVCIIEAMKIFNPIESDVAGRVIKILKEPGSPVEYGEELFYIEPI